MAASLTILVFVVLALDSLGALNPAIFSGRVFAKAFVLFASS